MNHMEVNHGILDDIECAIQSLGIDNDAPQDGVDWRMLINNADKVADKVANTFGQTDEGKAWVRGYVMCFLRSRVELEFAKLLNKEREALNDRAFVVKAFTNLDSCAVLATEAHDEAKG